MLLEKERKKKANFRQDYVSYTSSVMINNCKLESLEGIADFLDFTLPTINNKLFNDSISKISLIQWLDVSNNKITSIHKDIILLSNLKILNLKDNLISDINKIRNLGLLSSLKSLSLRGNLVCKVPGYRQFVVEMCAVLERLDNAVVSEKELDIIKYGGSKFGERRENGNGRVIRYPNPFINK